MNVRLILVAAIVTLGATACGATPPPAPAPAPPATPSPFPARPKPLPVDQTDPCALLTPAQQTQLGIQQAAKSADSDGQGSASCVWDSPTGAPDHRWLLRAVTAHDAAYALDSTTGVEVVTVAGYGAVETVAPGADPNQTCVLVVDVAPGQSLGVQYDRDESQPIGHDQACAQTFKVAEMAITNLSSR